MTLMQSIEYLQAVLVLQSVTSQAFFFLTNQPMLGPGMKGTHLVMVSVTVGKWE
jgi:hypothetical protein